MEKIERNFEIFKLNGRDEEILKILEKNGRVSILSLAKRLGVSHETIRYRLRKLLKAGVIERFTISVDHRKLGYKILAVIMISTWNYGREDWNEFLKHLMENENVVSIAKVTGDYDLKIAIMARDPEEFDSISHAIKTRFSRIIKEWHTFIFTKQLKRREFPF
jgi:DNA-binding Lrp family transcriptional regulator